MDRLKVGGAEDVMDRICIDPHAVSRWLLLLEREAGSAEAAEAMPEERATVEPDGRLLVSVEWRGLPITMYCEAHEWAWAVGCLQ